jgi:hypothetical protein
MSADIEIISSQDYSEQNAEVFNRVAKEYNRILGVVKKKRRKFEMAQTAKAEFERYLRVMQKGLTD